MTFGAGPPAPAPADSPKLVTAAEEGIVTQSTGRGHRAPPLADLAGAVRDARDYLDQARAGRDRRYANVEGGDVASAADATAVARHVANYLGAVELAERAGLEGAMLDVGSGVGALGVWAADRLGVTLHLADHDPTARAVAARAFPQVAAHADVAELPEAGAAVVTAMEVVEHLPPRDQQAFLSSLWSRVAPGGVLALSTPDERGYLGGWSGYAPHVGVVDPARLTALLEQATDQPACVWSLAGGPFRLGLPARLALPIGNRVWGWASRAAPGLVAGVSDAADALTARLPHTGRPGGGRPDEVTAFACNEPPPGRPATAHHPDPASASGLLAAVFAPGSG